MEECAFIMPHRFGSGGFKTARFYGTRRSPVNAQANARAGALGSTPHGSVPYRKRNDVLLPEYQIHRCSGRPVDSMMVLATHSVDDVRGNRTNSVPRSARKWRSRRRDGACVKLSQAPDSRNLFVVLWSQARQQTVKLIEAAELHG
jgi:hypothetical protein